MSETGRDELTNVTNRQLIDAALRHELALSTWLPIALRLSVGLVMIAVPFAAVACGVTTPTFAGPMLVTALFYLSRTAEWTRRHLEARAHAVATAARLQLTTSGAFAQAILEDYGGPPHLARLGQRAPDAASARSAIHAASPNGDGTRGAERL